MTASNRKDIVIVGAGLSGLCAASVLCAHGVRCLVLDARARAGGRALSVTSSRAENAVFDVGPTWYWPDTQPRMARLVAELRLTTFPQHVSGMALIERFRLERAQPYSASNGPGAPALRLDGGAQSLVDALVKTLSRGVLQLDSRVTSIDCREPELTKVEVLVPGSNVPQQLQCRGVILALPPRLIASSLALRPALPESLLRRFNDTPTWLGGQAKAVAVYAAPFWRELGHSGLVSSVIGPLQEIHDASPAAGVGALFGFFGLSPQARKKMALTELREATLRQLTRLFGDRAANPLDFIYQDWAQEPYTASARDLEPPTVYLEAQAPLRAPAPYGDLLMFAGTELALEQRGYMEGALEAAERAAALALALVSR